MLKLKLKLKVLEKLAELCLVVRILSFRSNLAIPAFWMTLGSGRVR